MVGILVSALYNVNRVHNNIQTKIVIDYSNQEVEAHRKQHNEFASCFSDGFGDDCGKSESHLLFMVQQITNPRYILYEFSGLIGRTGYSTIFIP